MAIEAHRMLVTFCVYIFGMILIAYRPVLNQKL